MNESMTQRLGIQSWCFRGCKTPEAIIAALRACQVDHLEICGVHVDIQGDYQPVLRAYRNAGIRLSGYGVQHMPKDETLCRAAFEFAVDAGIPVISAHVELEAIDLIEGLCVEYGCRVAHHNHGRKHPLGSVAMLDELFRRSSTNIGLCLDTAWMLDSGEDPVAVARKYAARLYGMHLKDFVFDRAGKPSDVIVGTGNLDLTAMAKLLREIDYQGYLTVEYEGDENHPVPALQRCVADVRQALGQ